MTDLKRMGKVGSASWSSPSAATFWLYFDICGGGYNRESIPVPVPVLTLYMSTYVCTSALFRHEVAFVLGQVASPAAIQVSLVLTRPKFIPSSGHFSKRTASRALF